MVGASLKGMPLHKDKMHWTETQIPKSLDSGYLNSLVTLRLLGHESIVLKIGKIKPQKYFSKLGTNGGNRSGDFKENACRIMNGILLRLNHLTFMFSRLAYGK